MDKVERLSCLLCGNRCNNTADPDAYPSSKEEDPIKTIEKKQTHPRINNKKTPHENNNNNNKKKKKKTPKSRINGLPFNGITEERTGNGTPSMSNESNNDSTSAIKTPPPQEISDRSELPQRIEECIIIANILCTPQTDNYKNIATIETGLEEVRCRIKNAPRVSNFINRLQEKEKRLKTELQDANKEKFNYEVQKSRGIDMLIDDVQEDIKDLASKIDNAYVITHLIQNYIFQLISERLIPSQQQSLLNQYIQLCEYLGTATFPENSNILRHSAWFFYTTNVESYRKNLELLYEHRTLLTLTQKPPARSSSDPSTQDWYSEMDLMDQLVADLLVNPEEFVDTFEHYVSSVETNYQLTKYQEATDTSRHLMQSILFTSYFMMESVTFLIRHSLISLEQITMLYPKFQKYSDLLDLFSSHLQKESFNHDSFYDEKNVEHYNKKLEITHLKQHWHLANDALFCLAELLERREALKLIYGTGLHTRLREKFHSIIGRNFLDKNNLSKQDLQSKKRKKLFDTWTKELFPDIPEEDKNSAEIGTLYNSLTKMKKCQRKDKPQPYLRFDERLTNLNLIRGESRTDGHCLRSSIHAHLTSDSISEDSIIPTITQDVLQRVLSRNGQEYPTSNTEENDLAQLNNLLNTLNINVSGWETPSTPISTNQLFLNHPV